MKTRVEKFLIQVEMEEPTDRGNGTVWKPDGRERFMEVVRSSAGMWSSGLTVGPKPEVTLTGET